MEDLHTMHVPVYHKTVTFWCTYMYSMALQMITCGYYSNHQLPISSETESYCMEGTLNECSYIYTTGSLLRDLVSVLSALCWWECGSMWRHSPLPPSVEHNDPFQQPSPRGWKSSNQSEGPAAVVL